VIRHRGAQKLRTSLDASIAEGAASEVFGACAGGTVLTGWALYLGASPVVIGFLGALPLAAQVVQIPAAALTHRLGAKRLAVATIGASRVIWLSLVALPFLHLPVSTGLAVFLAVIGIAALLGVVGSNAWTAWMGDLVPGPIRGRFFGRRMVYLSIAGTLTSLCAGLALDVLGPRGFKGETLAALAAVACAAGVASIWLLLQQHDPGHEPDRPCPMWREVARSVRDPAARPFLGYLFGWNVAVGVSASFFSFHMLANLKMGFALAAVHGIAVAIVRIVTAPAWGRVVDRFGARPVLIVCSFGISLIPAIWLFATPDRWWPIALEALLGGTLWGGHGIAAFDLSIGLSPRTTRPFYLGAFATAGGLGFAASSMLAGLLAHGLTTPLHVLGASWGATHVLFLLSAVGRAAAAGLALRIDEPAARSVTDMLRALVPRASVRSPGPATSS
jgi:MFS family permease